MLGGANVVAVDSFSISMLIDGSKNVLETADLFASP